MPYTTVVAGTAITASWGNANVRDQVVTPFASAAARTTAITSPIEGMVSYQSDLNLLYQYSGAAWVPIINPPICSLTQTVAQSIPNAANTDVLFDTEVADSWGWHSTVTNTNRVTPNVAGWFLVTGKTAYSSSTGGGRVSYIYRNGSVINGSGFYQNMAGVGAGTQSVMTFPTPVYLNGSTDYVTLNTIQNSGGAINTFVAGGEMSSLSVVLLRAEA